MPRTNPKLNVGPAEDRIWRIINFYYVLSFDAAIMNILYSDLKIKKLYN